MGVTFKLQRVPRVKQVADDSGLAGLSDKDVVKRVMPFAQFRMKEAQRAGKQVPPALCPMPSLPCIPCVLHRTLYPAITPGNAGISVLYLAATLLYDVSLGHA